MNVLQIHNHYIFPGGEDTVAASEASLLSSYGHHVFQYHRSNHELKGLPLVEQLKFYLQDIYFYKRVYKDLRKLIDQKKPDVAHCHNAFFLLGPAAYEACFDAGVPVVQTLHNYRFLCAAGTFFRNGHVCEDCVRQGRGAGIKYGCWHGFGASFLMTRVIETYEKRGLLDKISSFIALSNFSRQKFLESGWNPKRMTVNGNFLEEDPGGVSFKGKHILYVGALQEYKGIEVLLKAWGLSSKALPLKVVGSGPMVSLFEDQFVKGIEYLGQKSSTEVMELIKDSLCVVIPSLCYENFPRVIIEAYACGVPVVASNLGALKEIVEDQKTGLLFEAHNMGSLSEKLDFLIQNPQEASRMGKQARAAFEQKYSKTRHYEIMMNIYQKAMHPEEDF
ncbi:MAG: glycosyltransferase family 4 protein [Candidatus Omnitrophica bacterium]|nr:glycosyltransferase family 4 protein [Candidatus Omnitrophota bacterium]